MYVCCFPIQYVLMESLMLFTSSSKSDAFTALRQNLLWIKCGRYRALEHLCAQGIKENPQKILERSFRCRGIQIRFPSHNGTLPSFVTTYYILSRFKAFTPFYYSLLCFSSAGWLLWQFFFDSLKFWPDIHGNIILSLLPSHSLALPHIHPLSSMVS